MLDDELIVDAEDDRRSRILSAAERAFIRHGFHGASMQHVAAEARMSAGNLYRYFQSKDAIVSGLIARDQAALARDFNILSCAPDIFAALAMMLRMHLVEAPIGRQQIILEIWAEHARNPLMAQLCSAIDRDVHSRLSAIVAAAARPKVAAAAVDADFVVRVMMTVVCGLFKRRVTDPDFDGEAEVALALGIFRAAFDGTLQPCRTAGPTGES